MRDERELPHLDDKVIAGWNGMMIDAYAHAGRTLDESAYTDAPAAPRHSSWNTSGMATGTC